MVFGAMTQANGFETGWSINNLRWTGDYIIIPNETWIGDIDINGNGSNIHFLGMNDIPGTNPRLSNICTLTLSTPYVLTSNISLPVRVSVPSAIVSAISTSYGGFCFDPTGYLLYLGDTNRICNVYTPNPFIVPSPFPTLYTVAKVGPTSGMMTFSNKAWFSVPFRALGSFDKFIGRYSLSGSYTTWGGVNVLSQNKYNIGDHSGISVDSINKNLIELSGFSITSNSLILNRFSANDVSDNPGGTTINRTKKDFVNIYRLFPSNMKPTDVYGIVVDREKGQWLFVNARVNSKWTICKFQMRVN